MKLAYAEIQDCQVILRMDARSVFRQGRITIPTVVAYPPFTKKPRPFPFPVFGHVTRNTVAD